MKRVLLSTGFIFFICIQFCFSQLPSVKTSVDRQQILIGEQLKYSVEASFAASLYYINWFNVPDSFDHFEVVTRGRVDTIENNGILTFRQTLTLTSFDSGRNTIPQLPINFDFLHSDTAIHLFTDSIHVNVAFSPLDSTKTFHDIKPIIEVKDEIPLWMWIAGAVLLILLLIAIKYLIKYLKKRKKPVGLFNSRLSPYEEALQSLTTLQNEQLLQKAQIKPFHTKLGNIFKRYLSRKTQKNLLNHTSSDILLLLNDTLLSKVDTSVVAGTLRMTDAVKFAKYSPPVSESEASMMNTKIVIEQIEKLIFTDQHPDVK